MKSSYNHETTHTYAQSSLESTLFDAFGHTPAQLTKFPLTQYTWSILKVPFELKSSAIIKLLRRTSTAKRSPKQT